MVVVWTQSVTHKDLNNYLMSFNNAPPKLKLSVTKHLRGLLFAW